MGTEQLSLAHSEGARPLRIGGCQVYIGTCSWADANFVKEGQFYPRGVGTDPRKRLQFYSGVFPTVEVDASFHALQPADRAAKWAEWTPSQFIFSVKAFALFTGHETDPRRLPKEIVLLLPESLRTAETASAAQLPEEALIACWDYFAAFADELIKAGKLSHVLFQFPKGQGYTPEVYAHLDRWEPYLRRWQVAVEIRHRNWLEEPSRTEFLSYLKQKGYAYVIPDMIPWAYLPPSDIEITAPWSVVRFHGRNPAMIERRAPTNRVYDYSYSADQLEPWAETVRDLSANLERIHLLFNNHYRGQSARNAHEIASMLERSS